MQTIKRDIYVTKNVLQAPIEVTEGTNSIAIEFDVRDYDIPASAAAVAYSLSTSSMEEPNKALADVSGNKITIIPSEAFFLPGQNVMQIRIIDGNSKLISFNIIVKCTGKMRFGDEKEAQQSTLIEQMLAKLGEYQKKSASPYNFKGSCLSSALPASGNTINDTYYCTDLKYRKTWNGSAWEQSSLNEADYEDELTKTNGKVSSLKEDIGENGLALRNDLSELFAENIVFWGSGITVERKNNVLEYTSLNDANIQYTGVFFPTLNRLTYVFTNINFVLIGNSDTTYLAFTPNPTAAIHGILFSISKISGNSVQLESIDYPIKSQNIEFNIIDDILYITDDKGNIAHISKWEYNGVQYDKCLGFYFGDKSQGTFSLKNDYITNMAVVGDSISALDIWQKTVSDHFMCNYTNYAVSGTSFSKPGLADTSQSFEERVKNITGDYDTIVVFGGTNDFGHGASLEVFEQSVNNTLTTLCTKYPTAKMFLITPPQRSDILVNARNNTLWDFVEILKKCAQKYGFKIIDVYSESGITTFNTNVYTKDNLHPNLTGMTMIANCFISNVYKYYRRFPKSLFPYLHKIG